MFLNLVEREVCSLDLLAKNFNDFTPECVVSILVDIANGLTYANSLLIIHRDLHLGNFLISKEGVVKVTDFGEGKLVTALASHTADRGAKDYRSPEGWLSSYKFIERCDVWSIGVIAYVIISGCLPFYDKDHASDNYKVFQMILKQEPSFEGKEWKHISSDAIDFIKSCLNKDPDKRFSSTDALKHSWFKLQIDN